jgi:2,3-bisphosphoglycerate-dependent phosphoglycerate mutase
MELYIIRHGQSVNNVLKSFKDRVADPQLTALGLRQAELLGKIVAEQPVLGAVDAAWFRLEISRLITSPMHRALQTSQPISRALDIPIEVWADVFEFGGIYLDHGEPWGVVGCPGLKRSDILRRFPSCVLSEDVTDEGWWKGDREEKPACQERAVEVAARVRSWAGSDQHVALVSHADFIDCLLKALFGQLPGNGLYYGHSNAGITRIDLGCDGRLCLRYMNRIEPVIAELTS